MKKYNCIVVFNNDKSIAAAYRELYEETGISSAQISLYHLMDMTYYYQDFVLEIYVGKLAEEPILREEANPLVWLPVTEDFADTEKFAGDRNIAHIVSVTLKYLLEETSW